MTAMVSHPGDTDEQLSDEEWAKQLESEGALLPRPGEAIPVTAYANPARQAQIAQGIPFGARASNAPERVFDPDTGKMVDAAKPATASLQSKTPGAVDFAPTPSEAAAPAVPSIPTGAGSVVPAHEAAVVDPKRQAQIATDLGQAREAVGRQGEAASGEALSEGATKANLAALLKKQADEAYDRIEKNKGSYQEQLARLADVQNEAASVGIDPARYQKDRTPAQRFMGAIAAAAAGAAAGWNHQSGNAYLESQERAQQADIEAQKEGIQAKRQRAADFRAALADQAQQMDADNATIREAAGLERESVAAQGEGSSAAYKAQIAQAASDEKAAMLGAQSGKELAGMNRYAPTSRSGGFDSAKLGTMAFEIMKADAANGVSTSPEQARARAFAVMTGNLAGQGGLAAKPAKSAEAGMTIGAAPQSVAWNPLRGIQGTDANHRKLAIDQYNATIMGTAHKAFGARTPEAQKEIMAGYIVNTGDTQDTIDRKHAAFVEKFGAPAAVGGVGVGPRKIVMRPITAPSEETESEEP